MQVLYDNVMTFVHKKTKVRLEQCEARPAGVHSRGGSTVLRQITRGNLPVSECISKSKQTKGWLEHECSERMKANTMANSPLHLPPSP